MDDDAWCGLANLERKDLVRQVHEDFLGAGAEILITNTYPTARFALEMAGLGEKVETINRRAVDAALEARKSADHPVYVAGSMSDYGIDFAVEKGTFEATEQALSSAYREQATILADAGVDLIVLEMIHPFWAPGLDAALETGLPIWLAPVVGVADDGEVVARVPFRELDYPLVDMVREMDSDQVQAVTVMHSSVASTEAALDVLVREFDKPIGAYPHWGTFKRPEWTFEDVSPEDFATAALGWIDQGARLVGGCCGIGPDHIAALRDRLGRGATVDD